MTEGMNYGIMEGMNYGGIFGGISETVKMQVIEYANITVNSSPYIALEAEKRGERL